MVATFRCFEEAGAVLHPAGGKVEAFQESASQVQSLNPVEGVFNFRTVGTDVSSDCAAEGAGDKGHGFPAGQVMFHRPLDQVVPFFSGFDYDLYLAGIFFCERYPTVGHVDDESGETFIIGQDVAAAAQDGKREAGHEHGHGRRSGWLRGQGVHIG